MIVFPFGCNFPINIGPPPSVALLWRCKAGNDDGYVRALHFQPGPPGHVAVLDLYFLSHPWPQARHRTGPKEHLGSLRLGGPPWLS